jgi:hypothetical protein
LNSQVRKMARRAEMNVARTIRHMRASLHLLTRFVDDPERMIPAW